ncbi:MAG: NDP-sugar synthase [Leptospirillia bacterium]
MATPPITRAMLLAAGRGARLKPLTDITPKPLVPVGGRPMVAYVIDLLTACGIREMHVNSHHLSERILAELGDGTGWGLDVVHHPETVMLGSGGGLANAIRESPELADGAFVMVNSDVLTDVDLGRVIAHHQQSGAIATLMLRPDPAADQYGILATDEAGAIRRILDHDLGGSVRELMFTGIQIIDPRLLAYHPEGRDAFSIIGTYVNALHAGESLSAYIHDGYWNDLGTPERLLQAEHDLAEGRVGGAVAP